VTHLVLVTYLPAPDPDTHGIRYYANRAITLHPDTASPVVPSRIFDKSLGKVLDDFSGQVKEENREDENDGEDHNNIWVNDQSW